jgi:hypothetical protein
METADEENVPVHLIHIQFILVEVAIVVLRWAQSLLPVLLSV